MDNPRPRQNDHLGVNKIGKNIRKSPSHQPNLANNNPARPQPQPQVYNISKNDFRSIVQQLTGSPSRESLPRPPQNPSKPQNTRLQKIRPAPLTQINCPPVPAPVPGPPNMAPPPPAPCKTNLARPLPPYGHPLPQAMQTMMGPGNSVWSNTAESPVSAYMRYLQSSLVDSGSNGNQVQLADQSQPHMPGQAQPLQRVPRPAQPQTPPPGLGSSPAVPAPPMPPNLPSPRFSGSAPVMHNLPSPRFNEPTSVMPGLPSPRFNAPHPPMPGFPSPQANGPGLLPSPTSQFLLPSPTAYPGSPYPLLSPGVQYPPPQTPNFTFSPMGQSGILGPGPQPPPSPGMMFPFSPSRFFPFPSPRWREH